MRLVLDSLIALMLVAILCGVLMHQRRQDRALADLQLVHESLVQLKERAFLQAAMESDEEHTGPRYPDRLKPEWFPQTLPVNVLVDQHHPWIDLAPPHDFAQHPPDPVIDGPEQAGFWYNPNNGVFRARVTPQITDRQTLKLYNQANGSALAALPLNNADRQPLAMQLDPRGDTPPHQRRSAGPRSHRRASADLEIAPLRSAIRIAG